MPSGITVTSTPSTRTPEPCAISQAERPGPQAVAGGAVGACVGEEPAGDPDRETDQQRAAAATTPARPRQQHQRPAVAEVVADLAGGALGGPVSVGQQRSHGRPSSPRVGVPRRCHADPRHLGRFLRSRSVGGHARSIGAPRSAERAADQESFETFYKDVRSGLLVQTYALTGDLQASQKAVRDAMVVTWHHWRKVSRLEDPEEYVGRSPGRGRCAGARPRWWSRMKGLDPEVAATLDALAKLPVTQRRVLLLSHLTSLPLEGIAREVGISRTAAERELQTATAQFAVHRDVESTGIRQVLEGLRPQVEDVRWPRPSIITRAGSARRRSHTTFGVAFGVAAVLVSGSGRHRRRRSPAEPRHQGRPPGRAADPSPTTSGRAARSRS